MVRVVIRVRYKDLPSGVHAEAEAGPRDVVIYLLPGLTSAQRKAALRRLRQEGSRHCGPRLPPGQMAVALAVDWLGVAFQSTTRAVRRHPFGTLVPATLAGALLAGFVFASAGLPVPTGLSGSDGAASWRVPTGTPGRGGPPASGSSGAQPGPPRENVPRWAAAAGRTAAPAPGSEATTRALPASP